MQLPLQITFRNMEPSTVMEDSIREKAAKLDQFYDRIMGCRVIVEKLHSRRQKGNLYHVRLDMTVPGKELVVSREADEHHSYTDVYVAIRDAFDIARRQLEQYASRRRGEVKIHEAPLHGRISQVFPGEGYGKIETSDGREIYFHQNSLLEENFNNLTTGMEVRFAETQGDLGPQASTVRIVGKHHIVS